jgi:hypothetical protein
VLPAGAQGVLHAAYFRVKTALLDHLAHAFTPDFSHGIDEVVLHVDHDQSGFCHRFPYGGLNRTLGARRSCRDAIRHASRRM